MSGVCGNCRQIINPGSITTPIMGSDYHSDCLYCTTCTAHLWNKPFIKKKDGTLYCGDNDCSLTTTSLKLPPIANNGNTIMNGIGNSNSQIFSSRSEQNSSRQFNNSNRYMVQQSDSPVRKNSHDSNSTRTNYEYNQMRTSSQNFEPKKPQKKLFLDNTKQDEPFIYNQKRHDSSLYLPNIVNNGQMNGQPMNGQHNESNAITNEVEEPYDYMQCEKCMESLQNHEKHVFNDKVFHKHCYTCDRCKIELFRMKKVHSDPNQQGMFCEPCFNEMFGPKCGKCSQSVTPYMLSAVYEGKIYHKECFVCPRCKRSFAKEKMYKNGNLIICQNCF